MKVDDFAAARGAHHLLDVREDDEWSAGHIEGAQHIPLGQLGARLGEVPRDLTVVAVCRSGHRSGIAANGLSKLGIPAENLEGGVQAGTKAGKALVTSAGTPGRVI